MHTLIDVKFPFSFVCSSVNSGYYKEMFSLTDVLQMAVVMPQVVLVLLLCYVGSSWLILCKMCDIFNNLVTRAS